MSLVVSGSLPGDQRSFSAALESEPAVGPVADPARAGGVPVRQVRHSLGPAAVAQAPCDE